MDALAGKEAIISFSTRVSCVLAKIAESFTFQEEIFTFLADGSS